MYFRRLSKKFCISVFLVVLAVCLAIAFFVVTLFNAVFCMVWAVLYLVYKLEKYELFLAGGGVLSGCEDSTRI